MKKKAFWVTGTLAATLLITSAAFACGGPGGMSFGGHHGQGQKMMKMVDRLDLNDEQRDAVWEIMDEQRDAMRDKRDDASDNRKALRTATMSDNYDETEVRALADNMAKDMSDMIVQRSTAMQRIRSLLNQEQLEQLDKYQDRGFGRGGKW